MTTEESDGQANGVEYSESTRLIAKTLRKSHDKEHHQNKEPGGKLK